ncbi:MAG: c-type cytochrome [Nitrospirales bacterium]
MAPTKPMSRWDGNTPVYQVLKELGDPMPAHYLPKRDPKMVKQGEELIKHGVTRGPHGQKTDMQSQYFACIDCHNVDREDPDLRVSDPETRLDYAIQNQNRFLPGTTFYGIVNRTSWYNGDYQKKYGDIASEANKDLLKAIQLCAMKCAMGRKLDDWEVQAVLAYFWSLELKLVDLNLSTSDWKKLKFSSLRPDKNQDLISWLKSFYLPASPATFVKPPKPITASAEYEPNIDNGKAIYVLSCLSCHKDEGITSFPLGNSPVAYQLLNDHTKFGANFSVYNAVRNGIKASPGKGYMPNYPSQRISDHQLMDLRAFINYQATHDLVELEPLINWIN